MKKVVGITGVIGSGKSTVCQLLIQLGYYVIDCDKIVHCLYRKGNEGFREIANCFGMAYIMNDSVDSRKLAQLVFINEEARLLLNSIIHPLVKKHVLSEINQADVDIVFIEAPLLFEGKLDIICDYILTVTCDKMLRAKRIVVRDGCSLQEAEQIISRQYEDEELISRSDFVLFNNDYLKMNQDLLSILNEIKEKEE